MSLSTVDAPNRARATGYGRKPSTHDATMTEVGPGTPLGEFMRRYWHPVALSEKVKDIPQKLRLLGEDLVIFRDRQGRPGLLHARCAHRGTTLYYGRVEENGIRCCYHGWLFDVEGRCLEQPCEADGGRSRDRVIQPWYPLQERYGLVWAYMGPPDKQPLLPHWDTLEAVSPGEKIYVTGSSFGAGGDDTIEIVPCNWLQDWENIMDPFHIPILHTSFSGVQFVPEFGVMPQVHWEHAPTGMQYTAYRKLDDGREVDRVTLALFPHVRIVPSVQLAPGPAMGIGWVVPVDDTNFRLFHAMRVPEGFNGMPRLPGKKWSEKSEEEHQRFPGDWEAQVGQGPISLHSEENLAGSDKGIVMLRRLLKQQIKIVEEGGDPLGVIYDPAQQVMKVSAGNFFKT
ncbi:aromatic ring-hydroxylating dioxygenase subunit alpha [Methylocella sp. CPCC 101449]|uniref:aromatic ring-hydroxylating dioxygenase subunit alpha n=1 Tax=Methylocella sp. CPCC 101449 TaxID=2987531 RepID=UPI0028913F9E|nr:aromatic ring-hydroxylating dioxygenase subunit alpha [Methylocella sp. CPCC 101449]MDT2023973.1 aromatic ring-hydroxylating dioxygenase subunit alpha [Methylocella sp. CPCC 101449]